ncbi:MAG: hypothetical protein QM640_10475 [Niabella sp.]
MKGHLLKYKFHYRAVACGLLILVLPGCNKHNNGSDDDSGNGTTTATGCKLVKQSTNVVLTDPQYYTFEYDANGNPSKITLSYNGAVHEVETVHPTQMAFQSYGQTIIYDVSYLDQRPTKAVIGNIQQVYTYDSKGRLATIIPDAHPKGDIEESKIPRMIFAYDDNNNVIKIAFHTDFEGDYATLVATGYDNHPSSCSGFKNSAFLQYSFFWEGLDPANSRYMFDQLSAHNILGYTLTYNNGYATAETFTYTYNDKGLPTQRDAALGKPGETPTKKYYDAWEYDCK